LERPDYVQAAIRAADFVLTRLRDENGRLLRSYKDGQSKVDAYLARTKEIVIIGDPQEAATQALLETIHRRYLPNKVLVVAGLDQVATLGQRIPLLAGRAQIDGSATAYVCENYACRLPVTEPQALLRLLE